VLLSMQSQVRLIVLGQQHVCLMSLILCLQQSLLHLEVHYERFHSQAAVMLPVTVC
jgi:hypothetical protein